MLAVEHIPSIPIVSKVPTMILGMDVSHGSPGQFDVMLDCTAHAGKALLFILPVILSP